MRPSDRGSKQTQIVPEEGHQVFICENLPFDRPFDRLMVLSKVEGLRAVSKVERRNLWTRRTV